MFLLMSSKCRLKVYLEFDKNILNWMREDFLKKFDFRNINSWVN